LQPGKDSLIGFTGCGKFPYLLKDTVSPAAEIPCFA